MAAYTVTKLITNAYFRSGRLSRDLQTPSGQQIFSGLAMLNSVIAMKAVNDRLIPYFTNYTLNAIVGQEQYFIPNLIYIETLTYNYNTIRFSTEPMSRREYQGSPRANNIKSLMQANYVERSKGGADLFLYFLPDSTYPISIWGKFRLLQVALGQDLTATLDEFYIEYLELATAQLIANDSNITFQPQNKDKLEEYEHELLDVSAPDLRTKKWSALSGQRRGIYGLANLNGIWGPC